MKTGNQAKRCMALVAPGIPTAEDAARLLRRELRQRGQRPWPAAEIEVFPGQGESLLLARPAEEERMYISTAALGFLTAYFDMEGY